MTKVDLKLDWCSHEAAKYAVEKWHYSHRMPKSKIVTIGAWEDKQFKGVVIFGYGATPEIGKPYKLKQIEIVELVRVALTKHQTPTSKIVAIALKLLKRANPGLRCVVSFADSEQGHHGGIYQATNWFYTGSEQYHAYKVKGEIVHPRTLYDRYGVGGQSIPWLKEHIDPNAERLTTAQKHKYVMPLDDAMRKQIEPLAKPYPKRQHADEATESAAGVQPDNGGATPTRSLVKLSE